MDADLEIQFPEMYSAWDSQHDYLVPAMVPGVKKVKWAISPSDAASVDNQDEGQVLFKLKKAGDFKVTATVGGIKKTVQLHVTAAEETDWDDGSQRYNNGVTVQRPQRPDGGWQPGQKPPEGSRFGDKTLACTNCHVEGGKGIANGDVKHTPVQTAGYSDEDLTNIITKGQKPEGAKMRTGISKEKWSKFHQWQMDANVVKGIIVYLRGLTPEAQGDIDFGGKGGWGGGGGGGHHDDSQSSASDAGTGTVQ